MGTLIVSVIIIIIAPYIFQNNRDSEEEEVTVSTPTNIKRSVSDDGSPTILEETKSLNSSSSDSITTTNLASPIHFRPSTFTTPGSPCLKPNRRSVEALRSVI